MSEQSLSSAERQCVLYDFNRTAQEFPHAASVQALFRQRVEQTPDAIAVEDSEQTLSYRELLRRSTTIAHALLPLLRRADAHADGDSGTPLVALCAQRTAHLVTAVLGILQAGAAYVPIEPAYPRERIDFILKDTAVQIVLTDRKSAERLPVTTAQIFFLEDLIESLAEASTPLPEGSPEDLAYVLYTSGTTGRPKGVCVPHRALTNNVLWSSAKLLSPALLQRTLFSTSLCFDISVNELFLPLHSGGTIVIVDTILALLKRRELAVTFVNCTPSALQAVLGANALPATVRAVLLVGEYLSPTLVTALGSQPGIQRVINAYGPTECTNYCTAIDYDLLSAIPDTIGRPIGNTRAYVLDDQLQPVAIGQPGELYIGGTCVAQGYLRRPELTAQRFLADPNQPGSRIYRTGDRAHWLPDGTLRFLGRVDRQVKVRGHRFELAELERVLAEHPAVQQSAVRFQNNRLIAYVTPRIADAAPLRAFLAERLPEYAIPSFLIGLDTFPRTEHGKLDESALPEPLAAGAAWEFAAADERTIAELYHTILGVHVPSPDADFVMLGGNSLAAVLLQTKIRQQFGKTAPLALFFQRLTVPKLAAYVRPSTSSAPSQPASDIWLVFQEGDLKRCPPLIYPHSAGGLAQSARWLAPHLDPDTAVYSFNHPHEQKLGDWPDLQSLAAFYVAELERRFPTGPLMFAGHSFGVLLSYEMIRQLRRRGRQVILLAIVDEMVVPMPPIPDAMLMQATSEHLMYYDAVVQHCEPLQRWFREYMDGQSNPANRKLGPVMLSDLWLLFRTTWEYVRLGRQRFKLGLSQRYVERMRQFGANPRMGEPDFLLPLLDDVIHTIRLGNRYLNQLIKGTFGPLDVPAWLFRARDKPPLTGTKRDDLFHGPPDYGWTPHFVEPVTTVDCDGDHVTIQSEPTVRSLGKEMAAAIASVTQRFDAR